MNSYDFWYLLFFVLVKCLFLLNLKIFLIFKDIVLLLLFLDVIKKKSWFYCMLFFFRERDFFCGSMMIGRKKINKLINFVVDIY